MTCRSRASTEQALRVSTQLTHLSGLKKLSKQYRASSSAPPLLLTFPPDPDKNSEESAKQKFLNVGHAFEVLSDPDKRKTYDRYGEEGLKQQQGGGGFHDPFDVFRSAFGFGGQQQQRRGQNMLAELEVELDRKSVV